jgi:hypothetical protein
MILKFFPPLIEITSIFNNFSGACPHRSLAPGLGFAGNHRDMDEI